MKINALLATICSGLCINAVPLSAQEQTIAQQEEQTPVKVDLSKEAEAYLRIVHINEQLDKLPVPEVDAETAAGLQPVVEAAMGGLSELGLDKDKLQKIKQAAEEGSENAQVFMGFLYLMEPEDEQERRECVNLFIKHAKNENPMALTLLGIVYASFEISEEHTALGIEMLEHSAHKGEPVAMYQLSMFYLLGLTGEQDLERAQYWYEKMEELPQAERLLYSMSTFMNHLEAAAEAGDAEVQCFVGLSHYLGIYGAEEDNEKALKWFRAAAEQNFAAAQLMLGIIYEEGEIVQQDLQQAEEWYSKAAAQGDEEAKQALEALKSKK